MYFASVAVARPLGGTLTYLVPWELEDLVKPGIRVMVYLGRRLETGWVLGISEETDLDPSIIKPIKDIVDHDPLFTEDLLEIINWVSDYYIVSPGYVCSAAMPPGLSDSVEFAFEPTDYGKARNRDIAQKNNLKGDEEILKKICDRGKINLKELGKEASVKGVLQRCYGLEKEGLIRVEQIMNVREDFLLRRAGTALTEKYLEHPESARKECRRAPSQLKVLEFLEGRERPVLNERVTESLGISKGPIDSLVKKGYLKTVQIEQERKRLYPEWEGALNEIPSLTAEQQRAADAVMSAAAQGKYAPYLLHGITGSGKTEVYIYLCHKMRERNKQALVLLPEISLTPQLYRRFQQHFGKRAALLHSGLSDGERFEQWFKAKKGEVDVVIGTRSAVFAPLINPGCIIVDEEHDGSYKQEETPRYNARDLALKRGSILNVPVVMGSATPAVESYYNALSGKYNLLELKQRYKEYDLPKVTIVDMREEFEREGLKQEISVLMDSKIKERVDAGEQTLVLINRRGYRARLICRECGRAALCRHCNVAMRYHKSTDKLVCHFCNFQKSVQDRCEYCNGELIEFTGIGVQRVEEIIKKDFPQANVMRMDFDTTRARRAHYEILEKLRTGEIDILVGTQMIAKGHDYPGITLVGVVSAETILTLPDFRHSEKTFQLLTQVAGRAGRGDVAGEVVVQTFYPKHFSIQAAAKHDYKSFYEQEIVLRERLSQPPFTGMVVIRFQGKNKGTVYKKANTFNKILLRYADERTTIKGPKSAPLSRLREKHRIQLILTNRSRTALNRLIKTAEKKALQSGVSRSDYIIDIDPYNLM